jgi:hypothetical protein
MALLKTNYKDDILLDTSGKRKYTMITNDDGTVSFVDVTDYSQNGDAFGAADINATNTEVNEHFASVDESIESLNTKFPAPDYANVVVINTTTYTVTEDGYVSLMVSKSNNGVGNALNYAGRILINDVYVWEGAITITGGSTLFPTYRSAPIPVKAGDSVQFIVGVVDALQAVFYPIRY